MSKSNLNIRFHLRTNHVNRDGTCAIMVRSSVNGEQTAFSTKLSGSIFLHKFVNSKNYR